MSCAIGEIVLVPIPFTDLSSRKVRPAIVIGAGSRAGDLFVAPISSQLQNTDLLLQDWKASGLNVVCGIKSQLATIDEAIILKKIGNISTRDKAGLDALLRKWLQL